jgi:hypothetical protein
MAVNRWFEGKRQSIPSRKVQKLHLLEFNDGCGMNALFREIGPNRT